MKGGRPTISAERALAHVDDLIGVCPGLSDTHFASLAGLSSSVVRSARKSGRIEPETEERILAVTRRTVSLRPPGEFPASLVRERLTLLMEQASVPVNVIAQAAGFKPQTLYYIMRPEQEVVYRHVYVRLMSLTLDEVKAASPWVDRWPTIVRCRSLQANGWSLREVGRAWSVDMPKAVQMPPEAPIRRAVADKIKAIYESIGDEPGPSPRAAKNAQRLGFKTPIHYDEEMNLIDEPSADEALRAQEDARSALCALALTAEGATVPEVRAALGCSERLVTRARREVGLTARWRVDRWEPVETRPGALAAVRAVMARLHYRTSLNHLDEPGLDYVALLDDLRTSETQSHAAA